MSLSSRVFSAEDATPGKSSAPSDAEARESQKSRIHETLERSARDAEALALAKCDEILSEAVAEHERQVAGFRFECSRLGSFLTIRTERNGNPTEPKDWFFYREISEREFSTSLNIHQVGSIGLSRGYAPDRCGVLGYSVRLISENPDLDGWTISTDNWGNYVAPPRRHWAAEADYPTVPYSRRHFHMATPPRDRGDVIDMSAYDYHIKFTTSNYARVAKDDRIEFVGLRATLYVPAGLGDDVHRQILAAT